MVRPDDFYPFQSPDVELKRPLIDIEDGMIKTFKLTSTTFWFCKSEESTHDLIISCGREPELALNKYVNLVLDFAQELNVEKVYTMVDRKQVRF